MDNFGRWWCPTGTTTVLVVALMLGSSTLVPFLLDDENYYYYYPWRRNVKKSFPLVIGVLSARNHFEQRRAIRDTWFQDLYHQRHNLRHRVLVKFLLGNQDCDLPPTDDHALDCYSRVKESLYHRQNLQHIYALTLRENLTTRKKLDRTLFCNFKKLYIQVDIHIWEDLVIDQIGIIDYGYSTHISLFDYATGASLISTSTSFSSNTRTHIGFRYIPIRPVRLPLNFRGYFLLTISVGKDGDKDGDKEANDNEDEHDNDDNDENDQYDDGDDVCLSWLPHSSSANHRHRFSFSNNSNDGGAAYRFFHFPRVVFRRHADGFDDVVTSIPPDADGTDAGFVSFRFSVSDADDASGRAKRAEIWRREKAAETLSIEKESEEFEDIVFVDVVDVYANLPSKFIGGISSLSRDYEFDFFLKTDDDVFLDVDVLDEVMRDHGIWGKEGPMEEEEAKRKNQNRKMWLGRFRRDWAVMRRGKWAESRYQGNGYPPFACGATYGISGGVAAWLSKNAADLRRYQGEDVSMGFWLAALGAELVDDVRFLCGGEDEDDDVNNNNRNNAMVNAVELSSDEIRRKHKVKLASTELKVKLLNERRNRN